MKDLERRNALVPIVGDFAGPRPFAPSGASRRWAAAVSAFYAPNVEETAPGRHVAAVLRERRAAARRLQFVHPRRAEYGTRLPGRGIRDAARPDRQ
jgi:hypothetical protein